MKRLELSKEELHKFYIIESKSVPMIAKELGVNCSPIYRLLKDYRIEARNPSSAQPKKKKPAKEKLYNLYVVEGKSSRKIAEEFGVYNSTVLKWLKNYKIPVRNQKLIKPSKEELYKLYVVEGKGSPTIAKELWVSHNTILSWLKKYNIEKPKLSKEELYELYIIEGKSSREIAKEFGVSDSTICNWFKKYNIETIKSDGKVKTEQDFVEFFKNEDTARKVVEAFGGDEVDVADILAVIYSDRVDRERAIDLLSKPSLRDYLGNFVRPTGGLGEIIDIVPQILKYDKNDIIKELIKNRLIEYSLEKLGPNPTKEQREEVLNELKEGLNKI